MKRLQRYMFNLCMVLSLMATVPMSAQSTVSLTSSSGHPGDEVEVSVMLSNAQSATALQINIPHTPYLSYVDGSAELNASWVSETHSLSVTDKDNVLGLFVYDNDLNTFKEGTGAFITFRMKLGTEPGTYPLTPGVILSDASGSALAATAQSGAVTVLSPKISLSATAVDYGSVPIRSTYSKEVSVGNIGNETLTVSAITSASALFTVSPASMTIAAGQQKTLTIQYSPLQYGNDMADVTLVSDASNGRQTIHLTAAPFSVNTLSVTGASGQSGEEVTIRVSMQNMEPIVAAQCSFTLPEALKYVEGSAALSGRAPNASHQLSETVLGDKLSFFIHSGSNTVLSGNEGELFTFKLLLDGTGGDYQLNPVDVLLSNVDGRDMTSEVNGAVIRIAAPRIACASELDFGSVRREETATQRFTVNNTGESSLTIQRVDFSNAAFVLIDAEHLPTIAPGGKSDIEVCYCPTDDDVFTGVMSIYSNDPENRMKTVELSGAMFATNKMTISGNTVSGETGRYALTVSLQNAQPVAGLQFDLQWIAGMAPDKETLSVVERAANHQIEMTKIADDSYRVYVYSMDNTPIASGYGPIISLIYNKVGDLGSFANTTIAATQVILSTVAGRNCVSSPAAEWQVGSLSGLRGDADDDGEVSGDDLTRTVDYLLETGASSFNESQADMNRDGKITIADVVEMIDANMNE